MAEVGDSSPQTAENPQQSLVASLKRDPGTTGVKTLFSEAKNQ